MAQCTFLVFAVHGRTTPALVTAVLVSIVAFGLAVELRRPQADQPEQLGWTQDERQQLIHHKSMVLVGYAAFAAAAVAGFVAFAVDSHLALWPMLGVLALSAIYGSTGVTTD
jgi:hypothetical protein